MIGRITFREIEKRLNIPDASESQKESLEVWYESVRDTPIAELTIEDICKACRQVIFPDDVVPEAITRFKADPAAGEKYDGELLVALQSVPREYWRRNVGLAASLRDFLNEFQLPDGVSNDDVELLRSQTE